MYTHGRGEHGDEELGGAERGEHARQQRLVAGARHVALERHVRAVRLRGDVDRHVATLEENHILTLIY